MGLRDQALGDAKGNGSTEGLADERDVGRREPEGVERPVDGGEAVGDEAVLRGGAAGETEAPVVDGQDVDLGGVGGGEGAEVGGAPGGADSAGVLKRWMSVAISRYQWYKYQVSLRTPWTVVPVSKTPRK